MKHRKNVVSIIDMTRVLDMLLHTLMCEESDSENESWGSSWSPYPSLSDDSWAHGFMAGNFSEDDMVPETDLEEEEVVVEKDMSKYAGLCAICQEQVHNHCFERCITPCGHTFHYFCITTWLIDHENSGCVVCRDDITPERIKLHFRTCDFCFDHPRLQAIQKATQYIFLVNNRQRLEQRDL